MEVYVLRHGAAVDVGEHGVRTDADRMLSDDGVHKTKAVAAGLCTLGVCPSRIVSSPLLRARQTANIVAELCGSMAVEESDALCPGEDAHLALSLLRKHDVSTMFVGHMPHVRSLVSLLVSQDEHLQIEFRKAACCCVAFDGAARAGQGWLSWFLPPRVLRKLG